MSWAIKFFFCIWLGIHRNYKFVQSFQVGVARYAYSDWKYWISCISEINIGMSLIFLHKFKHTLINLYNSVHSYGSRQAHRGMSKIIANIKSAICQDWIELHCWFFTYGLTSIESEKWCSYFKQLNNQVLRFWPTNSHCQWDCLFFYIRYI